MAIGDVLSVTVPSKAVSGLTNDGGYVDVDIEGFDIGMNWDLGSGVGVPLQDANFDSASAKLSVTSPGFDETGITANQFRTLVGTHVARLPYPNQSSEDQALTGGGASVRIWLNGNIYASDTVTATISPGAFVNSAGASESSNSVADLAVTNQSTLSYPQITAKLDRFAGEETGNRVKTDFMIAVNAIAGHKIAAVRVTATGRLSSHQEDVFSTATVSRQRSATGLSAEAFECSIPISGFQQGELIDCRFRVYPVIGDAGTIVDTNGATISTEEILGRNLATLVCDKNDLLDQSSFVDPGGSDVSGDGSFGAPYATIGKALLEGANLIELLPGVHAPGNANTRITSDEWAVVRPAPGADASTVTLELTGTRTYRHQRLKIHGCTVSLQDSSSWLDGEHTGNHLQFRDCVFDSDQNGTVGTPTVGPGYRTDSCTFINCSGDLGTENWRLQTFGGTRIAYEFDGCQFVESVTTNPISSWFHVIACRGQGHVAFATNSTASLANNVPLQDGAIFGWNQILQFASLSMKMLELGALPGQPNNNIAIVGNVFEKLVGTSPAFSLAADNTSTSAQDTNDIKVIHNTIAGERVNASYNDSGTVGYDRVNWFVEGNSFHQFNIKADTFGTGNGNRSGGWPVLNGVHCRNNHWRDGLLFPLDYQGPGTTFGSTASPADPGYVDDQSGTSGSGNGNYAPDDGSILIGRYSPFESLVSFDLFGNPMRGDVGAVQTVNVPPAVTSDRAMFLRRRFSV